MIAVGRVFIIDYKLLHNLSNVEDYTERNTTDRRKMEKSRSPFCTFVVTNVRGAKELKPVAIQTDLIQGAPVFSPVDGLKWLKAKQEIQRADLFYVELVEHLLKTHLLMEPICVIMRRTLSVYHPLHQILRWHCRGLFVVNSIGMKALLGVGEFLDKLFAFGHTGSLELLKRAYPDLSWADTEFNENLKRRGVHKAEDLPYFPYRDDGLLIWKNVGDFARDYVKLYYLNDKDVKNNYELKYFANQLSADGTGKKGGIGMLKGFPAKIQTRSQLIDVLKRIVFIPVQHHSVNYPVVYYAGFVPNLPSKLYEDPRVPPQEFGFNSLPQVHVAAEQLALSMSLGSIRYDVFLDYGKHLKDDRAKAVVNKYHNHLIGSINDEITARNKRRFASGKLSYPYLLPKWMPNSIHT
ncbi:arachidonate 5-lipoxygenase-like [Paramuricea clavata]|nr:arachidonate 5-lipoxygenase-like [Paramuricea clavata]